MVESPRDDAPDECRAALPDWLRFYGACRPDAAVEWCSMLKRAANEIERLRAALREIAELTTGEPDEATMDGALDAIKSCCEGALVGRGEDA